MPHAVADVYQPVQVKQLAKAVSHLTADNYQHIQVRQLGETFTAEVSGVDFSKPVPPEVFKEVHAALAKYGAIVFRKADLDDDRQVEFSRLFGTLGTAATRIAPGHKHRLKHLELFDVGNIEEDGSLCKPGSKKLLTAALNTEFHIDLIYNPRRGAIGTLRAAQLPPPGNGGDTDFADTRTAWDDLPEDLKHELLTEDYIGCNSILHARKVVGPKDSPWLQALDPEKSSYGRYAILDTHEASGRKNLFLSVHLHHLEYRTPRSPDFVSTPEQPYERVPQEKGMALIKKLLKWCEQPKYVSKISWENENDLIVWDNTCTMHRTGAGTFMTTYKRDMRRCTSLDDSSFAWGLNPHRYEPKDYCDGLDRYMPR